MSRRGFSLVEMLFALALAGMLIVITTIAFGQVLRRARHNGAVRQLTTDLREARSLAISTGWQYRLVGYDAATSGSRANQYRLLGRRNSTVAWPAVTDTPFQNTNQLANPWIDISGDHPGVTLDADDEPFEVTFDSRGSASSAAANFNPVRVVGLEGLELSLTVSVVGGVRAQ